MRSSIMRRMIAGLSATLFPFALASAQEQVGAKSFEGIMTVQAQNSVSLEFYTYSVKNERVRIEPADRDDSAPIVVIDYFQKKMFVILPGNEQYVQLPVALEHTNARRPEDEPEIQKTQSTEDIQGFTCDQLMVKADGKDIEVWATKEIGTAGTFITKAAFGTLEASPWQREILGMGYFPMRVVELDSTGDEVSRREVTAIQKKSLSEALFRVPSTYEQVDPEALRPKQPPKKKRTR